MGWIIRDGKRFPCNGSFCNRNIELKPEDIARWHKGSVTCKYCKVKNDETRKEERFQYLPKRPNTCRKPGCENKCSITNQGRRAFLCPEHGGRVYHDPTVYDAVSRMLEDKTCFYCGSKVSRIGVDHFNPHERQLSIDNSIPACPPCNFIKNTMQPDEFLLSVRSIAYAQGIVHDANLGAYVINRNLDENLTSLDSINALVRGENAPPVNKGKPSKQILKKLAGHNCYLCRKPCAMGVDRFDPSKTYEDEANLRSCCAICNYMKKHIPYDLFIDHIVRIFYWTGYWVLRDITKYPLYLQQRQKPANLIGLCDIDTDELLMAFMHNHYDLFPTGNILEARRLRLVPLTREEFETFRETANERDCIMAYRRALGFDPEYR